MAGELKLNGLSYSEAHRRILAKLDAVARLKVLKPSQVKKHFEKGILLGLNKYAPRRDDYLRSGGQFLCDVTRSKSTKTEAGYNLILKENPSLNDEHNYWHIIEFGGKLSQSDVSGIWTRDEDNKARKLYVDYGGGPTPYRITSLRGGRVRSNIRKFKHPFFYRKRKFVGNYDPNPTWQNIRLKSNTPVYVAKGDQTANAQPYLENTMTHAVTYTIRKLREELRSNSNLL